ncbi:unnamed protein product [Rhizophagus irregularis]|nr:unnamed protein product [Rhizophagus irregularis]
MDLRTRKSGLNQQQQLQDTSFRLPPIYPPTDDSFYVNQEHQDGENSDNNFEEDNFKNNDDDDNFENNDSNFKDNDNYSENNNDDNFENKNDDYDFESNDDNNDDENVSSISSQSVPSQSETRNLKQYDCNDKKFNFSGKAGPYFPNYTHFLLFMWVTKYQIGCEAFRELSNIVKHPDFNPNALVRLSGGLPKYRNSKDSFGRSGSAVRVGFRSIETPKIRLAVRVGFRSMEKPSFDQMFRRTGKFQDSFGCASVFRRTGKFQDSIWWASKERKTKKPRFVRSGGLPKNENPKIRSGGLPKNENPKIKIRSGGLPKNENPKIKIHSGGLPKIGKMRTFKIRLASQSFRRMKAQKIQNQDSFREKWNQDSFSVSGGFQRTEKNQRFFRDDVPLSLSTIKQHRNGLPLITFNGYNVNICDYNTPSTSKSFRQAFIFPLKSILFRILSNEQLRKQMYFGPGIYSDDKRELWHGDIWHKSPLFGSTCIQINNVKYNLGEFVEWHGSNSNTETSVYYGRIVGFIIHDKSKQPLVKVEQIINFDSLPRSLKSRQRKNQSHIGMLWMTDKSIIIEPTIIESKIRVWLTDINQPDRYEYFIEEIVYIANGIWTIRSINLRHRHPIEYIQIQDSPRELPIYKFFLDIYIDKFGPFRNAYHAIGGVYLQVGNMPQVLRQKLKNHFLLGFIPFAATCDDVLKPLVSDIKELESGFEMDLGDERIWIMGGLGDITSDLPEGNEQAGVKNHNANYGCRNCTIHRNELHDMSFDILANG